MNRSRLTTLFEGSKNEQRIAVFIKQTHTLPQRGPMRRVHNDAALTLETVSEGPDEQFAVGCTIQETDLWEGKPWTDVVVRGHVRTPADTPMQAINAGVCVGRREKWVRVCGDRRVRHHGSSLSFGDPEPFTSIELSWRRAYGGIDLSVPHREINDLLDLFRLFDPDQHPGAYPRNPAGRGWVLHDDPRRLDGMLLPNFESPSQLLGPSRLVVGDRRLWANAPIPAGFGWWRQSWFPRSALLGLTDPEFVAEARELPEVRGGWLDAAQIESPRPDFRFQSGASPGLRFADLACGEPIRLVGFSPTGPIETSLPPVPPEVIVGFDRRPLEVALHLATVELLPDVGLANLVWVALSRPPVRFPRSMPRPDQRIYELLAGIDVVVDGEHVPNEVTSIGPSFCSNVQ